MKITSRHFAFSFIAWLALTQIPEANAAPKPAAAKSIPAKPPAVETVLMNEKSWTADKGRVVADKDARSGFALKADPADKPGAGYIWYGYTYSQQPGQLKIFFRLKAADNTSPLPVISITANVEGSDLKVKGALASSRAILGTDFKAPNVYQDFELDILKGELGYGSWTVSSHGVTPVWFEGFEVRQASRFSAEELLALLEPPPKPSGLALDTRTFRVHETHGLFMGLWRVKEATSLLPQAEYSKSLLKVNPQGTGMRDYPTKWEELYRYSAVVLDNVPAKAITLTGTILLKQWVEDGGTLILMGDTHGLAQGQWQETALGPLLPVTLQKTRDVVRAQQPLFLQPRGSSLSDLNWKEKPYTLYYHRAELRAKSTVLLASGQIPLIVQNRAGKGRIVVLLTSVLGKKSAGAGVPLWNWSDWPALMARLLDPNSANPDGENE